MTSSEHLSTSLNGVHLDATTSTDPTTTTDSQLLPPPTTNGHAATTAVSYENYKHELQLQWMSQLIERDLSEPYSIFTYRYFLNNWPHLCILAMADDGNNTTTDRQCIGCIIGKLEPDKHGQNRGYIAMLAVDRTVRKQRIGQTLVQLVLQRMIVRGADLVYLETEVTNTAAIALYERLGFVRDRRLCRYYLNNNDAFRLRLFVTHPDMGLLHDQEAEREADPASQQHAITT